jgi:hypothetical protein
MGDHEARGSSSIRETDRTEDREDWRDQQITVVEKRMVKPTVQGMPPLDRAPADKQDK